MLWTLSLGHWKIPLMVCTCGVDIRWRHAWEVVYHNLLQMETNSVGVHCGKASDSHTELNNFQFSKLGKFWYVPVPQDDKHLSQSMEICFLIIFLFQLLPANNVLADYTQLWWPHLKVPFRSFNGHSLNQLYPLLKNVEGEVKNCYNHIATLHPFICKNTLNIISIVRDPSNPIQPSPVHL